MDITWIKSIFTLISCSLCLHGCHGGGTIEAQMSNVQNWGNGRFQGHFVFPIRGEDVQGWEVILNFSSPVSGLVDWIGDIIKHSHENKEYILVNKPNNAIQHKGSTIDIMVQGTSDSGSPPSAIGKLINMGHDDYSVPTLPDKDATKYNYNDVLHKSIMFYEAQRSGKLPADNEISWRGDSALNDSGINGEDLTGGWYDGAGSTKFGFPMSASTTLLGWGLLQYKDAYQAAGLLDKMYDCIRWSLEWMLKCRTGPNELYIQVGDESEDHNHWERPESLKIARPAKKIDASHPGSDVAGEYAAAMTVGYLVFKEKDPSFAQNLLKNAEKINEFAESFHGRYSDSLTTGNSNYKSSSYHDELSWAGAWLYRATNQSKYLQQAETYYQQGTSWAMSWDDKSTGVAILLHNITGKEMYKQDVEATLQNWMSGGSVLYSPKGLAHRDKWGPLRYASNMAFMALLAADDGLHVDYYRQWATSQIHYALGDTGRSYVCGFGINPPTQPYHKGSSCPLDPVPCGFNIYRSRGPNPHVLYGALVSGPDNGDNFRNIRSNSMNSNVACDYNAGFQSAVAGLKSIYLSTLAPTSTSTPITSTSTPITSTSTQITSTSTSTTSTSASSVTTLAQTVSSATSSKSTNSIQTSSKSFSSGTVTKMWITVPAI